MTPQFTKLELQNFWKNFSSKNDFNKNQFVGLCRDTDEETVFKIASLFCQTLESSLQDIHNALEENDADIVWQRAHKVAGTAELLGFSVFGRTSRELSHQIKANSSLGAQLSEINDFVALAQKLLDEVSISLQKN